MIHSRADYAFVEGPQHVLPVLFSAVAGIDLNDPLKYLNAFTTIATYCAMIPLADCSKCSGEEHEEPCGEDVRAVCEQTSRFEDFMVQFMDRVLSWISSSRQQSVRLDVNHQCSFKSRLENVCESALASTLNT